MSIIDFSKSSKQYLYNKEDVSAGKYIDDNSLYLLFLISRNVLCGFEPVLTFIYMKPFEWSNVDYLAFLIKLSRDYDLEINKMHTEMGAIKDDYETSDGFHPIYEWYLEKKEEEEPSPEVKLLMKMEEDKANIDDIEKALVYSERIASIKCDGSENHIIKNLFMKFFDYTSFAVCSKDESATKLKKDIDEYLELFISDELKRDNATRYIHGTHVEQSLNISTYKHHDEVLKEYLIDQYKKYGDKFTIKNIFEDYFPNVPPSEISSEFIRKRYRERDRLFFHTVLAFHFQKLIRLGSIRNNWSFNEDEDYIHLCDVWVMPKLLGKENKETLSFDEDKSRFYVQGEEIKIKKFGDEYHTLKVLFEDLEELSKEWFFSEISEKLNDFSVDDKKYYNAIYQTGMKLKLKGIDDFFITTKQSVKINSKYLS